jgi:hypothetical protein
MNDITEPARGPGRPPKKFPVKLLRGYFPRDIDHPKHPTTGSPIKVERGEIIALPLEEAKDLMKRGIAERADELPA